MANVYTSLSNATIYTDKVRIATGNTAVSYNVYAVALGSADPVGNLYTNPVQVPANWQTDLYVGVGNKLTVSGTNYTALEIGTASSATVGVISAS